MKKLNVLQVFMLVFCVAVTVTSCSTEETESIGLIEQTTIIDDYLNKNSLILNNLNNHKKSTIGLKDSFLETYKEMSFENTDVEAFNYGYNLSFSTIRNNYTNNHKISDDVENIIYSTESALEAILLIDSLIQDENLSEEKRSEYILAKSLINFLNSNNENLGASNNILAKEGCGWWASWGKCNVSIIAGALTGAGGGCVGGATVGALVTSPSGLGAAAGATVGCVIGAVGGAIAGGLSGAVDGCDGC